MHFTFILIMLKNLRFVLLVIAGLLAFTFTSNAQLKRKPPGEIDRDAPDTKEEIHREVHDIKARERQMKATRVYTDMNRISLERKKMRMYKKRGMWEDYMKTKNSLALYKMHLKADRKKNRQMDVFD